MGLTKNILLWASSNRWMKEHLPRYSFVRRAVRRFMPGETLSSALEAVRKLEREGFSSVLTYLGENVSSSEEAIGVRDHYLLVLDSIRQSGLPTEVSVKLTQLGLDMDPAQTREHLEKILRAAQHQRLFVWIDIESSPYVDRTLELYASLRRQYSNVGVCLQSYLYRTDQDLTNLLPLIPSIRLVKGAYREPPTVAIPRKQDVDRNYMALAKRLLEECPQSETRIGIATHDREIAKHLKDFARTRAIPSERFEFQMLYGIGKEAQRELVAEGYHVRVLVSYGSAWFPWYMRRLAERPANVWFVVKSLVTR